MKDPLDLIEFAGSLEVLGRLASVFPEVAVPNQVRVLRVRS